MIKRVKFCSFYKIQKFIKLFFYNFFLLLPSDVAYLAAKKYNVATLFNVADGFMLNKGFQMRIKILLQNSQQSFSSKSKDFKSIKN